MNRFVEAPPGKNLPLSASTPHQRRIVEMVKMQQQDRVKLAGEAFAQAVAADGRKATELSKRDYAKLKANLFRSTIGVPPR